MNIPTDTEIKIALARAAGWQLNPNDPTTSGWGYQSLIGTHTLEELPDYLTDRNALQRVIERLKNLNPTDSFGRRNQRILFVHHLMKIRGIKCCVHEGMSYISAEEEFDLYFLSNERQIALALYEVLKEGEK